MTRPETTAADLRSLAADAYVFGFPLVFNLSQVERFTREGLGSMPPVAFNEFAHASKLAGPDDTFVSVNNDTVYSIAQLDLRAGAVRLDVPDADGRYYVMQFVDAWTNNFAYVGRRGTGTEAASWWIVPPGWPAGLPPEAKVIHAPTTIVSIVGRWAVDGDEDLPAVRALQAGLRLTSEGESPGLPAPDLAVSEDLRFLEQLRVWSRAFPPAPTEQEALARFGPLGIFEEPSPFAGPAPDVTAALREGVAAGRERLEQAIEHADAPMENGWQLTYHAFDYNNDFFEVGALDDPAWRIADRGAARVMRATAARAGLWGNHGYEAAYAMSYVDGDGDPLSGDRSYTITFAEDVPVDAFWSITMYDLPDFYLVANPIARYSIGDRTRNLRRGDDGLTLVLQHDDPGEAERANWLPAPAGRFRPIMRLYLPRPAVFDGSFVLPPIVRRT